jgi:hypothetical protein
VKRQFNLGIPAPKGSSDELRSRDSALSSTVARLFVLCRDF